MSKYLSMNTTADQIRSCRLDLNPGFVIFVNDPTNDTLIWALNEYVNMLNKRPSDNDKRRQTLEAFRVSWEYHGLPLTHSRIILLFNYFIFPAIARLLKEQWDESNIPPHVDEYLAIIRLAE